MRINLQNTFLPCFILCLLILCSSPVWARQIHLGPYASIVAKDPFDPNRGQKDESETDVAATPENDIEGQYQVYGTIIMGGRSKAFIKKVSNGNPRAKHKRGKTANEMRSVVVGDMVDGWEVKEITKKGIVLQADGKKAVLGLFDSEKKERKAKAPVALQTPQLKPPQIPTPAAVTSTRPSPQRGGRNVRSKSKSAPFRPPNKRIPLTGRKRPAKATNKAAPPPLPPAIGGPKIRKPPASRNNGQTAPSVPANNPFLEMIRQYQGGK